MPRTSDGFYIQIKSAHLTEAKVNLYIVRIQTCEVATTNYIHTKAKIFYNEQINTTMLNLTCITSSLCINVSELIIFARIFAILEAIC